MRLDRPAASTTPMITRAMGRWEGEKNGGARNPLLARPRSLRMLETNDLDYGTTDGE